MKARSSPARRRQRCRASPARFSPTSSRPPRTARWRNPVQGSSRYTNHRTEGAMEERDQETAQEKVEKARGGAFPAGVPEDADKGTGLAKGTGLPPGSVCKHQDTPQTPAT